MDAIGKRNVYLFILCVCTCLHGKACMWRQGTTFWGQFSPSIIRVLSIKLRSSGLVAALVPLPTEPSYWHHPVFETGPHIGLISFFKEETGGSASHRDPPVSASPALGSQTYTTNDSLLHGFWGSNPAPSACALSALPNVLSSWLPSVFRDRPLTGLEFTKLVTLVSKSQDSAYPCYHSTEIISLF